MTKRTGKILSACAALAMSASLVTVSATNADAHSRKHRVLGGIAAGVVLGIIAHQHRKHWHPHRKYHRHHRHHHVIRHHRHCDIRTVLVDTGHGYYKHQRVRYCY